MSPAKSRLGQLKTNDDVKNVQMIVPMRQNFKIPEHVKFQRFIKYPPRKVPPPPAGTVTKPAEKLLNHQKNRNIH